MRAAIVGGGIGGLAAAVALRRVGIETVVFERAERLDPVGAGLTLSPNAVRALERLGLAADIRALAASGTELEVSTPMGATLMQVRMTPDLGQGAGQALEDAVVLAACVRDGSDVEESLRRYEAERIARTSPIVWRSRRFGQLASASHRRTCGLRNGLTARTPARVQTRQHSQILDYELPEL